MRNLYTRNYFYGSIAPRAAAGGKSILHGQIGAQILQMNESRHKEKSLETLIPSILLKQPFSDFVGKVLFYASSFEQARFATVKNKTRSYCCELLVLSGKLDKSNRFIQDLNVLGKFASFNAGLIRIGLTT